MILLSSSFKNISAKKKQKTLDNTHFVVSQTVHVHGVAPNAFTHYLLATR